MTTDEIFTLKKQALETFFQNLNSKQQQAVFSVTGPVLVLAGAGSGKTTAIISRIVNMIYFGTGYTDPDDFLTQEDANFLQAYVNGEIDADAEVLRNILANHPIRPWSILAITFTNKAAGELRARLEATLGEEDASDVYAATFHSMCVRILRKNIEHLGFQKDFAIYDTDDSRRIMRTVMAEMNIQEKQFPHRMILSEISNAKNQMLSPKDLMEEAEGDYRLTTIAKLYSAYQRRLREANALDFDDIIFDTVVLFRHFPEDLAYYQKRWKYIMVDEYQDTNIAQYQLISLLSATNRNLCVVGDDDQSIYRFRGATIENILGFEDEFPDAAVIRLEQNYRSTQNILDAANSVIAHNTARKEKHLWTDKGAGEKLIWYRAQDAIDEAEYIANQILENIEKGESESDHAILYRMNAQSNLIEQAFIRAGIPYRIYGGLRFFERKEIKDMTAYMAIVQNPHDFVRFQRIVNEPKRGIGEATIKTILNICVDLHLSPLEVLHDADAYPALSRKTKVLKEFAQMWLDLITASEQKNLSDFLDYLLIRTGYKEALIGDETLKEKMEEGKMRLENIEELKTSFKTYEEEAENPNLEGFLEEIALYTDVDKYEPDQATVSMMTVHSAKGLEFKHVYLPGWEQGVFPGYRSMGSPVEMEEERRLAYVALTRAKETLTITTAQYRVLFGMSSHNDASCFLKEIDTDLIQRKSKGGSSVAESSNSNNFGSKPTKENALMKQIQEEKNRMRVNSNTPQNTDFAVGDRIHHKKFGDGTILTIKPVGNDKIMEVSFDEVGTKKFMATYARVEKI